MIKDAIVDLQKSEMIVCFLIKGSFVTSEEYLKVTVENVASTISEIHPLVVFKRWTQFNKSLLNICGYLCSTLDTFMNKTKIHLSRSTYSSSKQKSTVC